MIEWVDMFPWFQWSDNLFRSLIKALSFNTEIVNKNIKWEDSTLEMRNEIEWSVGSLLIIYYIIYNQVKMFIINLSHENKCLLCSLVLYFYVITSFLPKMAGLVPHKKNSNLFWKFINFQRWKNFKLLMDNFFV